MTELTKKAPDFAGFGQWIVDQWLDNIGLDLDGGDLETGLVRFGLILPAIYDPKKHGEMDTDPGDPIFVAHPATRPTTGQPQ